MFEICQISKRYNGRWQKIACLNIEEVEGKEEKMKIDVLFMRISKTVEFGINLNIFPGVRSVYALSFATEVLHFIFVLD